MTASPKLPASGTLVQVQGLTTGVGSTFDSVGALRNWHPTFPVKRVQIWDRKPPTRQEAQFGTRPDGTLVSNLDGMLSILAPNVDAALNAYRWAYGRGN